MNWRSARGVAAVPALVLAALLALGAPEGASLAAARPAPATPHPAASRYLSELPLMAGLWESGSGYLFPMAGGGRLAETRLLGRVDEAAVRDFYAAALDQAGWRPAPGSPAAYRRGRERLVLHVAPHRAGGGVLTEALFVVMPDPGPPTVARKSRSKGPNP